MKQRYITNTVELLYISLMLRWQRSAPPDGHQAPLDGVPTVNSQAQRLAYILKKIVVGQEKRALPCLARYTRRNDGESYVSTNRAWMDKPLSIADGWWLEGTQSLKQKLALVDQLGHLGHSGLFIEAVGAFVSHEPIDEFVPTPEQQEELLEDLQRRGEMDGIQITTDPTGRETAVIRL